VRVNQRACYVGRSSSKRIDSLNGGKVARSRVDLGKCKATRTKENIAFATWGAERLRHPLRQSFTGGTSKKNFHRQTQWGYVPTASKKPIGEGGRKSLHTEHDRRYFPTLAAFCFDLKASLTGTRFCQDGGPQAIKRFRS